MKRWFEDTTLKLILRIIVGIRESDVDTTSWEERKIALSRFFRLSGVLTVADVIPWLRWLDLGGYEKAMREAAAELDGILQGWLEEHKKRRLSGDVAAEDFLDLMLTILDGATNGTHNYDADTINKATCLVLILGGSDTVSVTLTWSLAFLLNSKHALNKAQEELETHVDRQRPVEESDMNNLHYLRAIVKETLRLHPPTLLSPAREATEDCLVSGYYVPAGTIIFSNLWKIHRDPRAWPDPDQFRPERFLTSDVDVDVMGHHFHLIPFGSGRRACPGVGFGLWVTQFVLASFLQAFEVSTPAAEDVDMTVAVGFTSAKATPLEVVVTPRLPAELYG